ncbi:hypothetical protein HWV62_37043 [Athelia sp. TMB]|nr:hypothetical protein HWV62_37043 [Athelia sp. TMB]
MLIALHTARKVPKATTANSYPHFVTVAKDDVSGIATTTTLNVNKTRFTKLAVNCRQKKSTKPMVPLYLWKINTILSKYQKLERAKRSITPSLSRSLIDWMELPVYKTSKPIPPGIRFKKMKIIEGTKEYKILILATGERLTYFQNKVDSLGLNEKYLDNVDKLIKDFN